MTEENYRYRTSQLLLRNQFEGSGAWKIPMIPKAAFDEEDFRDLRLIGFDKTKLEDERHLGRIVHFFLYDYKFERVWKDLDHDIEKLKRYRAALSPDFSMYIGKRRFTMRCPRSCSFITPFTTVGAGRILPRRGCV